jgi:outer membrane protein OmpA-like peptidoglycan-associated protein
MAASGNNPLASAPPPSNQEAQWISLSDLMTGLMLIFMLIAITFMMKVEADSKIAQQKAKQTAEEEEETRRIIYEELDKQSKKAEEEAKKVKQMAVVYDEIRRQLYDELHREFDKNLKNWGAEITPDLAVRFFDPEVLFNTGQDNLKPKFQNILSDFFPRYIRIITAPKYKTSIQEIRIEGHTSNKWVNTSAEEAYFKNMELSQSRTRSTLRYLLGLADIRNDTVWLHKYMTANGLSSSRPITNPDGTEDATRSQRVEFRIRTDAESRMVNILEAPEPNH